MSASLRVPVSRRTDPAQDLRLLGAGQLSPGHGPAQRRVQAGQAAGQRAGIGLDRGDLQAAAVEHLGDPRPHGAEPDHRNRANFHAGEITVSLRGAGGRMTAG